MGSKDIVSRFGELKDNLVSDFRILHSKLDQYEQVLSQDLDRLLSGVLEQASLSGEKEIQENDWKSELQELSQSRENLFTQNAPIHKNHAKITGDVRLDFDLAPFETALPLLFSIDNSLSLSEQEEETNSHFSGCNEGHLPGELNGPRGLSIDSKDNVYICDQYNKRIQVFSNTGEYLHHFGDEHLTGPWSVAISGDNAYVTDTGQHGVFWFTISDGKLVKKMGGKGTGKGQFNVPHGIDVSRNGEVFICDCFNDRITVLDAQLNFVKNQCENQVIRPDDVKIEDNKMLVLDLNVPCLQIFNSDGLKIHSLIQRVGQEALMTKWGYFFSIDVENNLVIISDVVMHCLHVYSIQGELLHTLGQVGTDKGEFMTPQGVGILSDRRIVTVCVDKKSDMLQIF